MAFEPNHGRVTTLLISILRGPKLRPQVRTCQRRAVRGQGQTLAASAVLCVLARRGGGENGGDRDTERYPPDVTCTCRWPSLDSSTAGGRGGRCWRAWTCQRGTAQGQGQACAASAGLCSPAHRGSGQSGGRIDAERHPPDIRGAHPRLSPWAGMGVGRGGRCAREAF